MTEKAIQNRPGWSISLHWVTVISLLYLALPCMLFFSSWFTPWVAWPVNLGIILSLISYVRRRAGDTVWKPSQPHLIGIALAALVCIVVFMLTGIAGYFTPATDVLIFREALYNNIIREAWPLVLPNGREMSYYLAGMLPPALLARLTEDYTMQRFLAVLWYAAGMWLTLLLFFCRNQKFSFLFLIFIFIFKDPVYLLINSLAGNGEIWQAVGKFISLPPNEYTGIPHPVLMMFLNAQGCNFHPYSLLAAALIINAQEKLRLLIPLVITLLLPTSPLGAIGCLPLAAIPWVQDARHNMVRSAVSLLLPVGITLLCACYYLRAESATSIGLFPLLQGSWPDFFLHFYIGIVASILLFCCILGKEIIRQDRALQVSIACCLILPWFYLGSSRESGLFGLNELWLKTSLIYHMHLIAALCLNWDKLPWVKYVYVLSLVVLFSRDERIRSLQYTGVPAVQDVWQGHLLHTHRSLYQKIPHCNPCCIQGLMLEGGQAEKHFPGKLLPKAPGCDYTRPMQPDGRFITH